MTKDGGGGGGKKTPKLADIICEQPLIYETYFHVMINLDESGKLNALLICIFNQEETKRVSLVRLICTNDRTIYLSHRKKTNY